MKNWLSATETKYAYDVQGRMKQSEIKKYATNGTTVESNDVATYAYDADGIRVSQTENGVETKYLYDKQNPTGYAQILEEKDASGAVKKTYTLGLDVISQRATVGSNQNTLYLLYDGHGSTRGLVDATGQPLSDQIYRYDAFGNRLDGSNALTSILYSGEQTDRTGLQYLRARYYDPANARFNGLDPYFGSLNDPLTLHKYLYCHNDPIDHIDPTGQWTLVCQLATVFNYSMKALSVLSAAQVGYKAATQGINALTFWDWLSVLPIGYVGAGLKYAKGMKGLKSLAQEHPQIASILQRFGGDIGNVIGRARGWVGANLGTRVHEAFKTTRLGQTLEKMESLLANSSWIRITLDTPISRTGGIGSRPDVTIQFPKFGFAIVLDIKPVPQEVFKKGWLASVAYLYEQTSQSIMGTREGTKDIFRIQHGLATIYLYLPYPSFFQ